MGKKKSALASLVVIISICIHVVFAVVASYIYITSNPPAEKPEFEAVEKVEKVVTEEKQVKVRLKSQSKKSSAPKKWIQADLRRVETPEVAVNIGNQPIGIGGLGGSGTDNSAGGDGIGSALETMKFSPSEVTFKGIKAKGEKVFFIIDASSNIMKDSKGGFNNYKNIRDDIIKNIESLNGTTLFNAIAYSNNHNRIFDKQNMVMASAKNKEAFKTWINAINIDAQSVKEFEDGKKKDGFLPIDEIAYRISPLKEIAASMVMHADLIFWITSDFPNDFKVRRELNSGELKELEQFYKKHKVKDDAEFVQKIYNPLKSEYDKKKDAVMIEVNKERTSKGLPPMVAEKDIEKVLKEKGIEFPQVLHDRHSHTFKVDKSTVLEASEKLIEREYEDHQLEAPSMNVVFFKGKDEEVPSEKEKLMRSFVSKMKGKHRVLDGLSAVK